MPDNSKEIESFGRFLKRFALAVDVVDDATFQEVGDLILKYVAEGLEIEFFEVLTELDIDGEPGLGTLWSSENQQSAFRLHNDEGDVGSLAASAVLRNQPHWVVAEDGGRPLTDCEGYRDLWSGATELPDYLRTHQGLDAKTSIVVPLQRHGGNVGAMCLESPQRLECTELAREEIRVMAEALAVLYGGQQWREVEKKATRSAIRELDEVLDHVPFVQPTHPELFIASPETGEEDVLGAIKSVLRDFEARVDIVHWPVDFTDPTDIGQQLLNSVKRAKFGICYLSEPVEDPEGAKHRYRDNLNVIFEAGMLHFMTVDQDPGGWIPVRETDAPKIPFDLHGHPRVEVPRDAEGRLNTEAFQSQLRQRVAGMLGDED